MEEKKINIEEEKWYPYKGLEISDKLRARLNGKILRLQERDSDGDPYLLTVPPGCDLPKWSVINLKQVLRECVAKERREKEERKRRELERMQLEEFMAIAKGGRKVHVYAYPSLAKICESYDNLLGIRGNAKAKLEKGGFRSGDKVYTYFDGEWCVKRAASRIL